MPIKKSGYLRKLKIFADGSGNSSPKRCWFELYHGVLVFARKSRFATGECIRLAKFEKARLSDNQMEHSFIIETKDRAIQIQFWAESRDEQREWFELIRKTISSEKKKAEAAKNMDSPSIERPKFQKLLHGPSGMLKYQSPIVFEEGKTSHVVYNLEITIAEAKNLSSDGMPFDPNTFMRLNLDNCKFATRVIKSSSPLFAENCVLELIDPKTSKLKLTVWNEGYRDKLLSKCTIPIKTLSFNNPTEEWYNLEYGSLDCYVSGSLRIGIDILKKHKAISLNVIEGKNFPTRLKTPQDFYVKIIYGKSVFKTKTLRQPERTKPQIHLEWNELFNLRIEDDEPLGPITFIVYRQSLALSYFLGQFTLNPKDYAIDGPMDKWIPLAPTDDMIEREKEKAMKKQKTRGSVRLGLKLTKRKVRPLEYYTPLIDLLMDSGKGASGSVAVLERTTKEVDVRMDVATNLIKIYEARNKAPIILKILLTNEINSTATSETLFRANSLASKAVDIYMKLSSFNYLQFCVKDTIDLILRDTARGRSYEIDHEKPDDAKRNWKYAHKVLYCFLEKLYTSQSECPSQLSSIFQHIQEEAQKKFPKEKNVKYSGVSGFLFLRFLCPAIMGPKLFDITTDHPSPKAANNLIQIARILQRIANMSDTSKSNRSSVIVEKEKFVESHQQNMKNFIDSIANPTQSYEFFNPIAVDLQQELSVMHDHLKTNLSNITAMTKEEGEVAETAKEMLVILRTMKLSSSEASDGTMTPGKKSKNVTPDQSDIENSGSSRKSRYPDTYDRDYQGKKSKSSTPEQSEGDGDPLTGAEKLKRLRRGSRGKKDAESSDSKNESSSRKRRSDMGL